MSAEKAFKMLAQKATDQWLSLAAAYRNFNRDSDGLIDEEELYDILNRFNIPIGPEEFAKLWKMLVQFFYQVLCLLSLLHAFFISIYFFEIRLEICLVTISK